MKKCFAASSGGHMEELSRLCELADENDFVFTEKSAYSVVDWCSNIYYTNQINRREFWFFAKFAFLFIKSFGVFLREKPDVIISTGALVTFPISLIGKMLGKKVIYIESFARTDKESLTGKLMYRVADLFIVQWEELLRVFPDAVYGGGIF